MPGQHLLASTDSIACRAFYGYFEEKRDLLIALLEDDDAEIDAALELQDASRGSTLANIREYARIVLERSEEPGRAQLRADLWTAMQTDKELAAAFAESVQRRRERLRTWIEQAITKGEIAEIPANAFASILLALSDGLMLHASIVPNAFRWVNIRLECATGADLCRGKALMSSNEGELLRPPAAKHSIGRPLIATQRLSKRFGRVRAVIDLGLEVTGGEIVGFLGPNGAGKTTTIRMLMRFINPTSGQCWVRGGSLRDEPGLRCGVGYLPGDFRMDPAMTGRDQARINEPTERLQLDPTRPYGSLSKGNRQKIGIVQALMIDPEVLVLDEPTTGLDPLIQRQFLDLVRDAAERGAAVLFSSHVLPEVERLASRVAIIRAGRLVTSSTVDQLMDHARHRVELRFSRPVPDDLFNCVAGVVEHEIDGRTAVITLDGPVGPAMRVAAAQSEVLRVSSAADELEDFL